VNCNDNDNQHCQGDLTCWDSGTTDVCTPPTDNSPCDENSDCTSGNCGASNICEPVPCFDASNWEPAGRVCEFTEAAIAYPAAATVEECATICQEYPTANCCYLLVSTVSLCIVFDSATGTTDVPAGAAYNSLGARYCPNPSTQ
jgi:hypothetical protein